MESNEDSFRPFTKESIMGTHHGYNTFPDGDVRRSVRSLFPERSGIIVHSGQELLVPVFQTMDVIRLTPDLNAARVSVPSDEPVIQDIGAPWNLSRHAVVRKPVSLGCLTGKERDAFIRPVPAYARHVLDMPIKFPATDIRLPSELGTLVPTIQRMIDAEAQLNSRYDDFYAYLSFHQASVLPGKRQREMPFHVDGFQGSRWVEKHPANHSYLVCDDLPTEFCLRGFPLDHLDLELDDVYEEMRHQIERDPQARFWSPQAFELILMDAYCVHRGIPATAAVFRTWVQLSWETRVFDRIGNAHNPNFDYDWEMVPRDLDSRISVRRDTAA